MATISPQGTSQGPSAQALVPLPPRLLPVDEDTAVPKPPRRPRFSGTALVLGFIPVFTFGLGVWQIRRLKWKVALIEEVDEKLGREPIPLPPRVNVDVMPEFAFRKVRVWGSWDHGYTMFFGPKKYDVEHGFDVITPLLRTNGTTVLVNRGFVANAHMNDFLAASRQDSQSQVEVLGMLHSPGPRNKYTPDNKPEEGEWHWLDLAAMKEHAGGDRAHVQAVLIDEIFDGHSALAVQNISKGIPVGIPVAIELRNMHAVYAATWFSLSAVTSLLFLRLIMRGRGPSDIFNKPPRRQMA
ncbi:SURF1 family-domain-containing protein [Auriculariales sp. MPI-PUGE-AT-0066]|nr:SURF1 family-domain-containing protein [Auriculariales sp. MPI-PUGE-AT-0066]